MQEYARAYIRISFRVEKERKREGGAGVKSYLSGAKSRRDEGESSPRNVYNIA